MYSLLPFQTLPQTLPVSQSWPRCSLCSCICPLEPAPVAQLLLPLLPAGSRRTGFGPCSVLWRRARSKSTDIQNRFLSRPPLAFFPPECLSKGRQGHLDGLGYRLLWRIYAPQDVSYIPSIHYDLGISTFQRWTIIWLTFFSLSPLLVCEDLQRVIKIRQMESLVEFGWLMWISFLSPKSQKLALWKTGALMKLLLEQNLPTNCVSIPTSTIYSFQVC